MLHYTATSGLQESSWGEELKHIANSSGLRDDWSHLHPSLRCLILDTETRTLKSASCQLHFPMICVRPKLKFNLISNGDGNFAIPSQCPPNWTTSSLIAERNRCYRIFRSELGSTFDEAQEQCQKHDGQLAIASYSSTLSALLNAFSSKELAEQSHLWIGLRKSQNGFQWIDKSIWTYENQIQWSDDLHIQQAVYGISLNFQNKQPREIQNSLAMEWKRWPKESNLTGFICQKTIFPQAQVALQINVNKNYQPIVSMQPIQLHYSRREDSTVEMSDTLLKDAALSPSVAVANKPLKLSKLTCFLGNATFSANYASSRATANYEANFNIVSTDVTGAAAMKWRAAEISCDTWDTWSPKNLQASWIMKQTASDASLTSLIVWLRHRTETYVPEKHDKTFRASAHHRAAFASLLHQRLIGQFVKHHPKYITEIMSAYDPVALEPEPSSRSLLIKFRIVLKPDTRKRRIASGHLTHRDDEISIFYNLHEFLSSEFKNSGANDTFPVEVLGLRSPDYCSSEITTIEGKFLGFPRPDRSINNTTELVWPQTNSTAFPTPYCITQDGHFLRRQCLGDRSSGLYWESLENKVFYHFKKPTR